MKKLLRSCIDIDNTVENSSLIENFQRLTQSRLEWGTDHYSKIFKYSKQFFQQRMDVPSFQTLVDYFENLGDIEALEALREIKNQPAYERASFINLVDEAFNEQIRQKAELLTKKTNEILNKGIVVQEGKEKKILKGTRDAVLYFQHEAQSLLVSDNQSKLTGDIREDGQEVWDSYINAKVNQSHAWGKFTGINAIDKVTHGIRRGELWTHAAFPGELKCLSGSSVVYDCDTGRRRTIEDLYKEKVRPTLLSLDEEDYFYVKQRVETIVENGIQSVFTLKLESGRNIRATDNHKFLTPTGWVELKDLKKGDFVATPKYGPHETKKELSPCIVTFLAYLVVRGYEDFFSNLNSEDILHLTKAYENWAGMPQDFQLKDLQKTAFFNVLSNLCEAVGCERVPQELFSTSRAEIILFLKTIWEINKQASYLSKPKNGMSLPLLNMVYNFKKANSVEFVTYNIKQAEDIQALLLILGIRVHIDHRKVNLQNLCLVFYVLYFPNVPEKNKFIDTVFLDIKPKTVYNNQEIPSRLIPEKASVYLGDWLAPLDIPMGERVSNHLIERLSTGTSLIKASLNGNVFWEKIVDIDYSGEEMTYDVAMPWHHNFIVNDIVAHNTTFALNWCYNLCTRYKTNVVYYTLEMTYEQVRLQIYSLHSAHPKWASMGYKPIPYSSIRDGVLTAEEEDFFKIVIEDFCSNKDFCHFELRATDRDFSIQDIKFDAEMTHKQLEVGFIVIDHGLLVDPGKSRQYKDYIIQMNSVVRDAKKMALHFNRGQKVPILFLFQTNREGKEDAIKNNGVYNLRALTYANEVEKSSDYVTFTFLDKNHRSEGTTLFSNAKNRDNALFEPFIAKVDFACRKLYNLELYQGVKGQGIDTEDVQQILSELQRVLWQFRQKQRFAEFTT